MTARPRLILGIVVALASLACESTDVHKVEGATCRPGTTSSNDSGKPPNQGGLSGSADGRIDRNKPNVLVGSVSEPHTLNDGSMGTRTVT